MSYNNNYYNNMRMFPDETPEQIHQMLSTSPLGQFLSLIPQTTFPIERSLLEPNNLMTNDSSFSNTEPNGVGHRNIFGYRLDSHGGGEDPFRRDGHRNFYQDDEDDDELKKVLELSRKESRDHSSEEDRNLVEKDYSMDEGEEEYKLALFKSMEEEKLRQEEVAHAEEEAILEKLRQEEIARAEEDALEKLRQEEIARAEEEAARIEKQQQQEEMELERALLLSKEQEERDARHRLLKEQDLAYQESLARDKAKEEQQQKEEERLLQEKLKKEKEEEDQELKDAIHLSESLSHMSQKERELRLKLAELPSEPDKSDPSAVHLVIQLPSGKRVERFFRLSNTFAEVKIFVDSRTLEEFGGCNIPENYFLVTDFPRHVWDNLEVRLSEAGFRKRQLIRVEAKK